MLKYLFAFSLLTTFFLANINTISAQDCCDSCCFEPCSPPPCCEYGYNPCASLKCDNCSQNACRDNIFGNIDFLWWRPCGQGLVLGEEFDLTKRIGSQTLNTHIIDLNYKYDPGFKLGIGYFCPCNCWEVYANWTHFHSKASASATIGTNTNSGFLSFWNSSFSTNITANLFAPAQTFLFTSISGKWTLDLDLVDFTFSKSFYVDPQLIARPFIGLKYARVNQGYHSIGIIDVPPIENATSMTDASCNFMGIGPLLGIDLQFNLCSGFSLFGKAEGALVFGSFDVHANENFTGKTSLFGSPISISIIPHGVGTDRYSVAITNLSFGLIWEYCLEICNRMHPFALEISWEQLSLLDINHFNVDSNFNNNLLSGGSQTPHAYGDMTIQGLNVALTFGF